MHDAKPRRFVGFFRRFHSLGFYTVVLPTLLAGIYYGLIASDIYVSESRLVVRSPQSQAPTGISAMLQGAGFSRSSDDTFIVHDYILSRDALKKLNDQFHLDQAFGSKDVDILNRFKGLDWWAGSFEALHRYYQKRVAVDVDSASSIATLKVNAFTAEDAFRINEKLVKMSEDLVNGINERARQDMIRFASAEVEIAENKAKAAALAVSRYRNLKAIFDPGKQSPLQLQLIAKLQDELIATKMQLDQIRALSGDNPQIPSVQKRLVSLQEAISQETAKVAGGGHSLSSEAAEYDRLALEQEFASKLLMGELISLEQARNEAQRKQLYLERIVQPGKPDYAVEPKRIRSVFATFVIGLVAWGILTILLAGVREHHN